MARPLRLEFPGAIHHVTTRGNAQRNIVRDDEDRRRFVRLLSYVVTEKEWILHAWVLMDNHYHLLVETPDICLVDGMHWFNQQLTETFNERHDCVGHIFQGRYKAVVVERETHLLELVRYIVLNPVRACMVRSAGDFAWSNYRETAGLRRPSDWLEIDWTLTQFGTGDRRAAQEEYRRFVADPVAASYKPWEKLNGRICLGSEAFRKRIQAMIDAEPRSSEHPRIQLRPALDLDDVAQAVSQAFGVAIDDLRTRSRSSARKAFALIAGDDAKIPLVRAGEWMGVTARAAVRMREVGRMLYATDLGYRTKIDEVRVKFRFKT